MPSLRESQGIKKDVSGNRNAKKLPIKLKWDLHCATKKGSLLQNKKDYPSIVSFLRRWRDLNPRATLMTYTLSRGTSSAS